MSITPHEFVMGADDARRLTERIRVTAVNYRESREKLMELVEEAKSGSAHVALGYASWTAYLSEVLGEEPMRLARDERQDMVRALSAEGMSTRAIAPIVGAHHDTVATDLKAPVGNPTPVPVPSSPGQFDKNDTRTTWHNPRWVDSEGLNSATSGTPADVTGLDGKRYPRSEPTVPRADSLPKQYTSAINDLTKAMDRLHRLHTSDRFTANKSQTAAMHSSDLARAISELQNLFAELTN